MSFCAVRWGTRKRLNRTYLIIEQTPWNKEHDIMDNHPLPSEGEGKDEGGPLYSFSSLEYG